MPQTIAEVRIFHQQVQVSHRFVHFLADHERHKACSNHYNGWIPMGILGRVHGYVRINVVSDHLSDE